MEYFLNNPVFWQLAATALAVGVLLGCLISWLIFLGRQKRNQQEIALLELRIKTQDALQLERESAFEVASGRLARAFSELSNQSLKSNSENFCGLPNRIWEHTRKKPNEN